MKIRRAVFLLLGTVLLLPYVLLTWVLVRILVEDPANRPAGLLITVVAGAVALLPPFLGGTRELEIAAVRALLRVDLPAHDPQVPLPLETRLRSALWFAVHLAVGAAIGAALLIAVPLALIVFAERLGLTRGALDDLAIGPLGASDVWWWTAVGVVLLLGTAWAATGLGALASTMAPVLLGPSPAQRLAAVEARERRLAERNRLARELHDSVGHALTATTLQAGAARAVFDTDPEFARRALAAIEEVGRAAMDDLDHVLGVLREDTPAVGRSGDLDRLLQDIGVDVEADIGATDLSPDAFRIAQESLTNAAKHGSGRIIFRIAESADEVTIEVINPIAGARRRSGGRGLAGMRERVRLLGGSLEAGPVEPAGDTWRVLARLPK
jgi:signal transduction histidine kinase